MEEKRVGFGPRFGAYVLDIIFASIFALILSAIVGSFLAEIFAGKAMSAVASQDSAQAMAAIGAGIGIFAAMIYTIPIAITLYFLLEAFTGQTLGKMILKIQVAFPDGKPGNFNLFIVRYLIKNASAILMLLGLLLSIGFLGTLGRIVGLVFFVGCFMSLGQTKLALHDIIAKTAVFNKDDVK